MIQSLMRLGACFLFLLLAGLRFAHAQPEQKSGISVVPLKRAEIIERVLNARAFEGRRLFPQQSSRERVAELNRLLVERGFASASVRIVDRTDGRAVFEWMTLGDPTFADLLKFSVGVTRLKYDVTDGVIEISESR